MTSKNNASAFLDARAYIILDRLGVTAESQLTYLIKLSDLHLVGCDWLVEFVLVSTYINILLV